MRVLSGLILALHIYGCGDPLRPADMAGTYTLVTVAGEALPWTMVSGPDCQTTVTGGTLVIGTDATFEMWRDETMACPLSAEPTVSTAYSFGEFQFNGRHRVTLVEIGDVRQPLPGRFTGERLLIEYGPRYGELGFDPGGQPRPPLRRN